VQHGHARAWQGWPWAGAPFGGSAPPNPCQTEADCCSNGLLRAGLCAANRGPWKASHGRGGLAGGRSSGAAPLACFWPLRFSVLGRPRKVISVRSCVKARLLPLRSSRAALRFAALTPAHYDWLRVVRTENTNCRKDCTLAQQAGRACHRGVHEARMAERTAQPWQKRHCSKWDTPNNPGQAASVRAQSNQE
jgi:hypothetical protein